MKTAKKKRADKIQPQASATPFNSLVNRGLPTFIWYLIPLLSYLIFSFFTFNLRISEGGDDSTYIIRAFMLLKEGRFPSYQGPLYPVILSLWLTVTGFSVGLLKVSSWLFLTLFLGLFVKAFHTKVSALSLWGSLMILVTNFHFLYFGSQTYSEAFFMMLQGLFLLVLFNNIRDHGSSFGWAQDSVLALFLLTLTLTRTIGLATFPALLAFLLLRKQYKDAAVITLLFSVATLLYFLIKYYLWNLSPLDGGQATSLLQKSPYDASLGTESIGGFLARFVENSKLYLSKHFLIMIGLKQAFSMDKNLLVSILIYTLFLMGTLRFIKTNPFLLFTALYLAFSLGTTFFSLQTLWDQERLIIPYFPLMVLFLIETIVSFTRCSGPKTIKHLPIALLCLSITLTTAQTIRQTDFSAIRHQLAGNRFYGYTPDWTNYLKMAEYVSQKLPSESYVACRKPNMASIFAKGKKFYGIYRFSSQDPDTLLHQLEKAGVTHVIAANLRKNPRYRSGAIINTIHRYLSIISKKYPKTFLVRKKIGTSEPAWLFEIDYNAKQTALKKETHPHE